MDLGINGRRALVTGATSGLGLAAAEALAAEGVDLVLFARNRDTLEDTSSRLRKRYAVGVEGIAGDMVSRADVAGLASHLRTAGALDILVLNTPRPPSPMRDFLDETEDERWEVAYANQLESALRVLRAVTPLLVDNGWGRIIGVTSASVKQPMPRHALSSVFRAGVQAALKHLVAEVGPAGVTVNSIAPATVVTPTFSQFHNLERRTSELPLRRAGTVTEFGAAVAFLASEHAGFITGQIIQFDGGLTASLV